MTSKLVKVKDYESSDGEESDINQEVVKSKRNQKWFEVETFGTEDEAIDYVKSRCCSKRSTNPANEKTGRKVNFR